MKQFILTLVAMTIIGAGTMNAQRNNRQQNNDGMYTNPRTEMRQDNRQNNIRQDNNRQEIHTDRSANCREMGRAHDRGTRRGVIVENRHPVVIHEAPRPVVVHEVPAPRPVVVRHHAPAVGAVVAGAVIGAVLTAIAAN